MKLACILTLITLLLLALSLQITSNLQSAPFSLSSRYYPPTPLPGAAPPLPTKIPPAPPTSSPPQLPVGNGQPDGMPAIAPILHDAPPGTPTFTEADVLAYYAQTHAAASPGTDPQVQAVHFLTVQEARTQLPELMLQGMPADRLVCLVLLSGQFSISAPSAYFRQLAAQGKPIPTYTRSWHIYDALTGNYLGRQVGE